MKLNNLRNKLPALAGVATSAVTSGAAFAQDADAGSAVTLITAAGVSAGLIGAAVLAVHVGIKLYKFMRKAL